MGERKWTEQQRNAIDSHGGTLLVSAAAGSGKTAVLVQRVIEKLISTDPEIHCDADRLLIVTFTRAAASEMKERISSELQKMLEENPWDSQLRRQMILLKKAQISTIHSFCSRLIRDNFYRLNISPDFRIADTSELKIMREECVSEVLEKYYAEGDSVFFELVEQLIGDKNDSDLSELIKNLEDYISSCPFPDEFISWLEKIYTSECPDRTIWAKSTFDYVKSAADYARKYNDIAREIALSDKKMSDKYYPSFELDAQTLRAIYSAADSSDWDAMYNATANACVAPLGRAAKLPPEAEIAKAARAIVKEVLDDIRKTVISDREIFVKEIEFTGQMVRKLAEILRDYINLLNERKTKRKVLDFSDLEHYSVRLLIEKRPNITDDSGFSAVKDYSEAYRKTDIALAVTESYDEIMLDEYQDTNSVQSLIFAAIARNPDTADKYTLTDGVNIFMVGDMKQSIYRFRKAVPEIFMNKFARYTPYSSATKKYPALITLGANFRSRPEVTECINFIFRCIMSEEMGGVRYDDSQELIARAIYPESNNMTAEMHFISRPTGYHLSSSEYEAEYIADMIESMISDGFEVTDKSTGKLRRAEYSDFCILRRSMSGNGSAYAAALEKRGIPAWTSSDGGLLETDEANVILSFIRVINNPLLDIPLMCVMMSPIYAFSPDEMAEIRLRERSAPLYGAVMSMAKDGNIKCAAFLESMDKFRMLASTMSADRLIEEIYYSTGYMAAVCSMPNGDIRLGSLRLLREFAASCEKNGSFGTSSFISTVDRMIEQGEDLPCATSVTENANVVRVMTVHKSKGLEFPICIVAGLGSQFNKDSDVAGVMTHNDLGLGMKMKENGVYYETQIRRAIINQSYLESLSEEMRVLYVALTRAREKLIMVATPRSVNSCINNAAMAVCDGDISPFALVQCSSFASWLMMAAIRHPDGGELRAYADIGTEVIKGCNSHIKIVIHNKEFDSSPESTKTEDSSEHDKDMPQEVKPNAEIMAAIEERLQYKYPHNNLIGVPTKVTASELTKQEHSGDSISLMRPSFMMKGGLTPTERGQALHKYMELANFKAASEHPEEELKRLKKFGFLNENEANAVDIDKVKTFFTKMRSMLDSADKVMRECEFSVKLDKEYSRFVTDVELENESIILEGECDCVLVYKDSSVIIDYKTDRISDPDRLIEHYGIQLKLYRYAMEKVLCRPVSGIYLYSFYLDKLIEVK